MGDRRIRLARLAVVLSQTAVALREELRICRKRRLLRAKIAGKRRVKIGRGHSWLPRQQHERIAVDFVSETADKGFDAWDNQFGKTTPRLMAHIADRLNIVDERPAAHKLDPLNRVGVFINRIKTGHTLRFVASRFGVSLYTAGVVFNDIQHRISTVLSDEIRLPDAEGIAEIERLMRERNDDVLAAKYSMDGIHTKLFHNAGGSTK